MIRFMSILYMLLAFLLPACKNDSSTGPTPTTTISSAPPPGAPTAESPSPGESLTSTQPTLTVANAEGGSGELTYGFEVASDTSFSDIEASAEGITEGEEGTTSWQVSPPLEPGMQHYWRVRATGSGQSGPYSETTNFSLREGFTHNRPTGGLVVYDPLTNGSSVGQVVGGRFVDGGWQVVQPTDYIRYQVPSETNGYVEFNVTNIKEPNPTAGKRILMIMWDPTRGDYRANPFRMHLQKMDRNTVNRWDVRLRWLSRGHEHNTGISFFDFEADVMYPWRVQWGKFPGFKAEHVKVYLEGIEILSRNYDKPYNLRTHWVELGGGTRTESLEEAIFSEVKIGSW